MSYKGIPIDQISLLKHPAVYSELFLKLSLDFLKSAFSFIVRRFLLASFVMAIVLLVQFNSHFESVRTVFAFAAYWVILGVASSIGLGTGLHTFVLYLGPHIAKVTMAMTACGYMMNMVESKWNFVGFGPCSAGESDEKATFFNILMSVQLEAFLWGLGTALGELPPYFIARKAALAQRELQQMKKDVEGDQPCQQNRSASDGADSSKKTSEAEQLEEIEELKRKDQTQLTFVEKAKLGIQHLIQKHGFSTILLCASIPNPLFDLAGITCGHFLIPFWTFFGATLIGKAIVKVHIQMVFVITAFNHSTIETVIGLVSKASEGLANLMQTAFEKQRSSFSAESSSSGEKALLGRAWDLFLLAMISYFLYSIASSLVQEQAILEGKKARSAPKKVI